MKILYLDCKMGAAGDMLTGALLELIPKPDEFVEMMNNIGIPGVRFERNIVSKCGIMGTKINVKVKGIEEKPDFDHHSHEHHHNHEHNHEHNHDHKHDHEHSHKEDHHHHGIEEIEHIVRGHISIPLKIQKQIMEIYDLIARAESEAHGHPVSDIHFHEVGTMDALADITSVCLLMDMISPDKVVVSPVNVGSGQVKCSHGIMPVPAPATAYILRETPIYSNEINSELCTPTGAALLKYFASEFGSMPMMKTKAIGYGMGKKDFAAVNCLRAFLGESCNDDSDTVIEIKCNLDDMTPEAIGFVQEILFEEGALDVYTIPIGMKKSRPGTILCCMCKEAHKEKMVSIIQKNTSTIGVRISREQRYILDRKTVTVNTEYGDIRIKVSYADGIDKIKPEYEDISRIAKKNNLTFDHVTELAKDAYKSKR